MPATVRTARSSDLPALARLCRAAVGPDDYVLAYLGSMAASGEVRLVEHRGRVVAMAGITESLDRGLWLGQLRSHPRFRRRGFARRLLEDGYVRVVREGRPALRLWTGRRNRASRALFESSGFRRVATYMRVVAPPLPGRGALPVRARAEAVWLRWRRSVGCRDGRGYVDYRWHFTPLTLRVLRSLERRREVYADRTMACLLWTGPSEPTLFGAVLAGGTDALLAMRRAAAQMDRESVEVFLPRSSLLVRSARRAGFRRGSWGRAAILYERPNPRAALRRRS